MVVEDAHCEASSVAVGPSLGRIIDAVADSEGKRDCDEYRVGKTESNADDEPDGAAVELW